jgi:predicted hotdog family 3-hydroxylacyl-ACP dehydratase
MSLLTSLPPVKDLLPHRGTMLLLDRLVEFGDDTTIAEYVPQSEAWYADAAGRMPAWIGIELMAQTIAAHIGLLKLNTGLLLKHGVLLGTRRYTSKVSSFLSNETLRIHVTMIYSDVSGLAAYECCIKSGTDELASATLKVFEPADFQAFLQGSLS